MNELEAYFANKVENETETSLKIRFLIMIASVIASLLIIELGIRSYDSIQPGGSFFNNSRNPLQRIRAPSFPFREFGYELYEEVGGVKYIVPRHGELYPLEKPPGTFRIVAFGGSTTANNWSFGESGMHYPKVLEGLLRDRSERDGIEVINLGYSAYATPHSLILLELDVASWEPDLVILSHNINDRNVSYWPDFRFDYSNKYADPFFLRSGQVERLNLWDITFQWSQLYWYVSITLRALFENDALDSRRSYGDEPNSVALQTYERNLTSFAAIANAHGVDVVFASQPYSSNVKSQINSKPKSFNRNVERPLEHEIEAHHRRFNEAMEEVASSTGSWFLDNNDVMEGRPELFIDQVHYSPKGVETLAKSYSDFIMNNGIVK